MVLLTSQFPSPWRPAACMFAIQEARALRQLVELHVVAPVPWTDRLGARRGEVDDPGTVYRPLWPMVPGRWALGLQGVSYLARVGAAVARRVQPGTVIYAMWAYPDGWAAVRLARQLNVGVVVKVLGSDLQVLARRAAVASRVREALKGAGAVVAVSKALGELAWQMGARRVEVVPNGVDQGLFRPRPKPEARMVLGLGQGKFILFVGRLEEVKGLTVLWEAVSRLGQVQLVVVGRGSMQGRLRALARELGIEGRIIWAGEVAHKEVALYMAACDCLVLPSLAEGEPNVVLEALGCGRPVVATRVGGLEGMMVDGVHGRLVPPGDSAALAEAIQEVLEREWDEGKLRMAVAGRSWEAVAARTVELFKEVVRGRCGSQPA